MVICDLTALGVSNASTLCIISSAVSAKDDVPITLVSAVVRHILNKVFILYSLFWQILGSQLARLFVWNVCWLFLKYQRNRYGVKVKFEIIANKNAVPQRNPKLKMLCTSLNKNT